jgi:hypothetical protein
MCTSTGKRSKFEQNRSQHQRSGIPPAALNSGLRFTTSPEGHLIDRGGARDSDGGPATPARLAACQAVPRQFETPRL